MIEYKQVKKIYNGNVVIEGLDLSIEKGSFVCLIGPSGCGKTTTLKMLNRLIKSDGGQILIDGKDINSLNITDLRRSIGYVIQQIGLFPNMTVAENIAVVPKLLKWDKKRIDLKVRELLELVDMDYEEYASKYPHEMSGGQQQRIGVLRALATNPSLILMDEPFSALDPVTRDSLQDEVKALQEKLGITIVFVTHDMDEAIKMADVIVFMEDGKIVQKATPSEMVRSPKTKTVRQFMSKHLEGSEDIDLVCRDLMKSNVFKVFAKRPIMECIGLMRMRDLNTVVVTDSDKKYLGVSYLDDLIERRDELSSVGEVVVETVPTFKLRDDAKEAISLMNTREHDYVLVLNDLDEVSGIITRGSIARSLTEVVWGDLDA